MGSPTPSASLGYKVREHRNTGLYFDKILFFHQLCDSHNIAHVATQPIDLAGYFAGAHFPRRCHMRELHSSNMHLSFVIYSSERAI